MTKKYDNIIAIDPDVKKSGVAAIYFENGLIDPLSATFGELSGWLQTMRDVCEHQNQSLVVVVEAGWLNKSNWHTRRGDNPKLAAAKGYSVGCNHEVGRKIVEMCKHYGIDVIEQAPLRKRWKGKDGKITHKELVELTGITKSRTNQEERDAVLLAWHYAGLPFKNVKI